MNNKFILTDGMKSVSITGNEGWNVLNDYGNYTEIEQYAKVAAAFRAYNLIANTVGNMPFILYRGKDKYDGSATWENKVGFLPNPSELFRLNTLSLIATNTAYVLKSSDVLGYKTKGLYPATAYSFQPFVNPVTWQLERIDRWIGGTHEEYAPDDPRLIRLWRMDHTSEVLPSHNTEAQAIMSAAGQIYYADLWISHFYKRGGIPPTLIAMKGLRLSGKADDEEKSWTDWLKGLGRFTNRIARLFNAEAMDVKQMGSSVADLKNNDIYKSAIENIAMGTGIPLSLLLANSANYATAQVENMRWIESDIAPRCSWLAYEYNRQVFNPLGLRLEFKPENLEPEQKTPAQDLSLFADFLNKCPTAEIALGAADTFGYELSDSLTQAIEAHFAEKKKATLTTPPTVQPQPQPELPQMQPAPQQPVAKWIPSLDELNELKVWREVAERQLKKGKSLDFIYQPHYGGLPADIQEQIVLRLPSAKSLQEIKAIFATDQFITTQTITPSPEYKNNELIILAQSIDKMVELESLKMKVQQKEI